jgi:hypothetical protein
MNREYGSLSVTVPDEPTQPLQEEMVMSSREEAEEADRVKVVYTFNPRSRC